MSKAGILNSIIEKPLNRYSLDIPTCDSNIDVEGFSGNEGLSSLYRYNIVFTSGDKKIDSSQMLNKSATLSMGIGFVTELAGGKFVHGVITDFQRMGGSNDQATYQVTLEPFLSLLGKQFRTHRFFLNKSVPEVVEQVFKEHGLKGWEYDFVLTKTYPKREQINQYRESDLAFVQRLLAEVGIFYFFRIQEDTHTEVIRLADDQSAWTFGISLPLNSPSGTNDNTADSVWNIHVAQKVVQATVTTNDYNHREAQKVLLSTPVDASNDGLEGTAYGDVYHYRARHLEIGDKFEPSPETGNHLARLEHERFLSTRVIITGQSTDNSLSVAQVLTITETAPIPTLPTEVKNDLVLIDVNFAASRSEALSVNWTAVPYNETYCWRPAALARPIISGTLMARVTSAKPNDLYAHLNQSGLYWVKFDADRDDKPQGYESMPVRLAKPYGGDTYGMHFPLIQGTEVAVAFHEGDPDRPYIAHALHDSRHPDHVTSDNNTRNVIRTAGLNKLRMEDKRGEEHVKLSTEYGGKTQLNLGHNVDAVRELRGEGFELRTDKWGALRAGQGIFISAEGQSEAKGEILDMSAAIQQLENSISMAQTMMNLAKRSQVDVSDHQPHEDQIKQAFSGLKQPALVASAPEGIALATPGYMQHSAEGDVVITAGENASISVLQRITLAAKKAISIFVHESGLKMAAAAGKMELEAQNDEMHLTSQKSMKITSNEEEVIITATKKITLQCNGAAIILEAGKITLMTSGDVDIKSGNLIIAGPEQPQIPTAGFTLCPSLAKSSATNNDGLAGME